MSREHVVRWEDPLPAAAAAKEMSGLDYLRGIAAGVLPRPPISALIGMEWTAVEEGRVVFTLEPGEQHYNPIGTVHGGVISTVLDSAMSCAVHTLLPAGTAYTTVDLSVTFLRAVTTTSGRLSCEGSVVTVGGRIGTASGRLVDETGVLCATGTATCLVIRPPRPAATP